MVANLWCQPHIGQDLTFATRQTACLSGAAVTRGFTPWLQTANIHGVDCLSHSTSWRAPRLPPAGAQRKTQSRRWPLQPLTGGNRGGDAGSCTPASLTRPSEVPALPQGIGLGGAVGQLDSPSGGTPGSAGSNPARVVQEPHPSNRGGVFVW